MKNFFHTGFLAASLAALLAGCGGDGAPVRSAPGQVADEPPADPATDPAPADPAPAEPTTATPRLPDVSGTLLLAVSVAIIRDTPVYFLTRARLTPSADGTTGTLDLRATPLRAADRTPVTGAADLTIAGIPVGADGRFSVDVGTVTIPGAANPLEAGDIVASLVLKGRLASADVICGDVQGQVTEPLALDLDGSTFAFARVSEGAVGAALPSPAMSACPR